MNKSDDEFTNEQSKEIEKKIAQAIKQSKETEKVVIEPTDDEIDDKNEAQKLRHRRELVEDIEQDVKRLFHGAE